LKIDVSAMASYLVDLPPNATVGMRTEQDGYDEAVLEIKSNQAQYGEAAGVTATDIQTLILVDAQIAEVDAQLPAAAKIVEILTETRAALDDKRQRLVSAIAQSAETRAKANNTPVLLAKYERTRAYRSAIAEKGAKTRRKKEEAAAAKKAEHDAKAAAGGAPKV
jgi:hypothetical protein